MFRFAVAIALLPTVALADYESPEDQVRRIAFGDMTSKLDAEAHASASASAGRDAGARASAGGEIAWNVGRCRALVAGGEGTAQKDQASGSLWGGFCFPSPINRMSLTVRGDYELMPSLAALPIAHRARYTGFSVEITNTFIGWKSYDEKTEHQILPMTFAIGIYDQPMLDTMGWATFTLSAYQRSHESGRVIEVLPIALRAAGPAEPAEGGGMYLSANGFEFSPFRVKRTSAGTLGDFTLEADFAAGLAYGEITDAPQGGMMEVPTLYRDYDLFVDTTIRAAKGDDTFALQVRRAFEPTYTDEILLDTRGDLSWTRAWGKNTLVAGAFGAITKRMNHAGPVDSTPSGGLRGAYLRLLPQGMQMVVAGEVARSFYPTMDDTLALDAAWSAQASATFSFSMRKK